MISSDELLGLLHSTETFRVERTTSTNDMDKFQEAICAFSNDLPDSRKNGYLILGATDNGELSGLKVDDALMKKISAIRSNGKILPLPVMCVERFAFPEGDLLVAEVSPSLLPPVRYRGRVFVRIGPRRDIASETEERILTERRTAYMATFDATPCIGATLQDLDMEVIENNYLPAVVDTEILSQDHRDIKACMHRDYQANMPVRLYQFDDHVEIMNAGGLYSEARPENFPTVNDYRNPVVAEAMKEMKYVNMFNQGIRRVQDMLRENGNPEAEFDVSKLTVFCVNVPANGMDVLQDDPQDVLQGDTQGDTQVVTISDKELDNWIEQQLLQNPQLSTESLARMCRRSTITIKRHIAKMPHIHYVGSGYSGHWEVEDKRNEI